ncbi:hypothetical protein CAEBREN_08960 [Caenorhabditis brenneri]|uniref:C-type lectin domain-containing protein n=1 Tax=Caenorhabditis brenneri TaxID=135651 RepID=G0N6H8_CAEBE|nr:hypothetical protein CAEBREN_08960 [Caenorhabditis brenneri]
MVTSMFLLISALILMVNAQCRFEDSPIGDLIFFIFRCYSFSKTPKTYTDASNYCHSINQNLAVVHNSQQNNFLFLKVFNSPRFPDNVRARSESSNGKFWIGLSRSSINSPFVWDDGTSLGWTNFDQNLPKDSLFVFESTVNGKWATLDGTQVLDTVCSYQLNSTTKPSVTCLFMVDMQSSGITQTAISTYQAYYIFAQTVAGKLNDQSNFSGYLDNFGYSGGLADHQEYPADLYTDFSNIAFPIDGIDDDIDLDLKDVDASLNTAQWTPHVDDQTCMIFFSAAPEAMYGGSSIQHTYDSFTTVIGVLFGAATSIPGLTDPIVASTLSDADAEAVVQKLLESLPSL